MSIIIVSLTCRGLPLQYKKSPPFVKGRGLRGGNVNISGTAASSSELRFPTRLEGIIDGIRYYITIALAMHKKKAESE